MARGDEAAAQQVYETNCGPRLRYTFRRLHGTREDAEEIVNDSFNRHRIWAKRSMEAALFKAGTGQPLDERPRTAESPAVLG